MIPISDKIKRKLVTLLFPVLLLLFWQFFFSGGYLSPHLLPSPESVIRQVVKLFVEEGFVNHILTSLKRVLTGFLIGSLSGFLFGLLMGLSRTAEKMFAPTFHVIRQVPIIGWIPLIVMWCGMTELPRIIIIAVAAFYPITLNTFAGVRSVSKEYIELASVYGYKKLAFIRKIVLPAAFPSILTGLSLSVGMSWAMLMAAEIFIETYDGIGTRIQAGREKFNIPLVITGIATVGLLGLLMTLAVEKLANVLDRGRAVRKEGINN